MPIVKLFQHHLAQVSKTITYEIGRFRGTNLRAKSAQGAIKLGIGTVVERLSRFVRNMILARILVPDEFGIMAIILVATAAFEAFTEIGVKQSIIHNKRGSDPEYLNVAWWIQAIRGLVLSTIAILAAPWISSFYDKPDMLRLLQVSFLAVLFKGLSSPGAHALQKEFKFGRSVILVQGSGLIATILTVGLAFTLRNVWALVIGFVAESLILCLLSFVIAPFLPSFRIDRECLGELMKFGGRMLGLPLLTFVSLQTPVLFLAKLVPDEQLGMYYLALVLIQFPLLLFAQVVYPVLLPAFAEKQDDKDSLYRAVLQMTRVSAIFCMPLAAFMASCSSGILRLSYGPEYVAVSITFAILCFLILTRTEGLILVSVCMAVGKPNIHRRLVALRATIIVTLMYPAIVNFGILGAAALLVLVSVVSLFIQILWVGKIIQLKLTEYSKSYMPGLYISIIAVAPVLLISSFGKATVELNVILGGVLCLVAWTVGLLLLTREKQQSRKLREKTMSLCDGSMYR